MNSYALVILAAGNSSRLGQPKQLLPYKKTNLLTHLINEAREVSGLSITVVLGAFADDIMGQIPVKDLTVIQNPLWEEGIGTSIRLGITSLTDTPDIQGAILAVCDQPFISSDLFSSMIQMHQSSLKGIVASYYGGTAGTPVLFSPLYFKALTMLSGKEGAKRLLKQYAGDTALIPFEAGRYDIDTRDDYTRLIQ